MESLEKVQAKPLAYPSTPATPFDGPISDEEESRRWNSSQYLRKRRCLLFCCGCCSAAVILLGVTILVLALTVFRIKDPGFAMNAIHVHGLGPHVDLDTDHQLSVNATLTAEVSIKNPNVASFGFDRSVTEFYYEGKTVGVAYAPGGQVSSGRTVRINVTVDVLTDKVAALTNFTSSVLLGDTVNLTSYTDVKGRVAVLGIYKRDLDAMINCSMTLDLSLLDQEVRNKVCRSTVM